MRSRGSYSYSAWIDLVTVTVGGDDLGFSDVSWLHQTTDRLNPMLELPALMEHAAFPGASSATHERAHGNDRGCSP